MPQAWYRMSSVESTHIDAMAVATASVVLRAYGLDWSGFPREKQFVAHATGAPQVPKRGGQPARKKRRSRASRRGAAAWRRAARSMRHSETALGAYHRRIAPRIGGDMAVFATAGGQPYVEEGAEARKPIATAERQKFWPPKPKNLAIN
jgi:hypothetical protein